MEDPMLSERLKSKEVSNPAHRLPFVVNVLDGLLSLARC